MTALWMADICAMSNLETCTWRGFGGCPTSETFASTDTFGRVHAFVQGSDGAMWENVFSSNPWNPSGARWIGHRGSISWSPQAFLNDHIYAYVLCHLLPAILSREGIRKSEQSGRGGDLGVVSCWFERSLKRG